MRAPEALVENAQWHRQDIEHATRRVISFYANEFRVLGTWIWARFATDVVAVVKGEKLFDAELAAKGFSLIFKGPKPNLIPVFQDGAVIWEEKEPRIILIDNTYAFLTPSLRNRLYRISADIAEEVADTYKLTTSTDPISFIFPKEEYADVEIGRGVML